MKKKALITGATAGIGAETARLLAEKGFDLVLTGRRVGKLKSLQEELSKVCRVDILNFDLSSRYECERAFSERKDCISDVNVLINNAGLACGVDSVDQASLDDWEKMIDTNFKGLLFVTRQLLPVLEKQGDSHIVNIGSVAGRGVYPGGAVYCATKFAVRAFTEGLRMDLQGKKVRVTNISPGMVETEFSEVRLGDPEKAKEVYKGMRPLSAKDIAECICWSLDRPQHVNVQEMVVYPTDQASMHHVHREF